jgi:hypothetical protein
VRIALIVGIDYYENADKLHGCVDDARRVHAVLSRHGDDSVNFDCKLLTATSRSDQVPRHVLKDSVVQLFAAEADVSVFYFAGHGYVGATGGYLWTSDADRTDGGLSLSDVLILANRSPARNRVILLDSCQSGVAGEQQNSTRLAGIADGVTILTASTKEQYATEENGHGLFSNLLVHALGGSAANLTGDITPGSVYAHIDQSLGPWEQRPVFKTNVKQFVSLRRVTPPITLTDLRQIATLFPSAGFEFKLDPTYEPELKGRDPGMPEPVLRHTQMFAVLQQYNRLGLLVPVNAPHLWSAAMQNQACRLTALGEHYRRLVARNRI